MQRKHFTMTTQAKGTLVTTKTVKVLTAAWWTVRPFSRCQTLQLCIAAHLLCTVFTQEGRHFQVGVFVFWC